MKCLSAVIFLAAFLLLDKSAARFFDKSQKLSPVILVPGDGGSQMEAQLRKNASPVPFMCAKTADWYNIWLNLEQLVIPAIYCFVDNIKLYYDNVTRTTHNAQGVSIRIPGWGDPAVVEWLDPTQNKAGAYYKDIANMLVGDLGYERKKNLLGAPYDFRKAPNELHQYFMDLKELVETAYYQNDKTPVSLISHSMGSPLTVVFLRQQEFQWKQKYIKRIISLSGAWGGSVKALKVFAMGDDLDALLINANLLKPEEISSPSTAWLLPSPLFWKSYEPLVQTPSRNYSVAQLATYFDDIGYRTGWEMRKDSLPYTLNYSPPDLEMHCLYGSELPTVERLLYKKEPISDQTPQLIMGIGDGTVNKRSLRGCEYWQGYQEANISSIALEGVNHLGILAHPKTLAYIKSVLQIPS